MKKGRFYLIFLIFLIFCNISFIFLLPDTKNKNLDEKLEVDTDIHGSAPISKIFSTDPYNPSDISINSYYSANNPGDTTLYIRVNLVAGEVYLIYKFRNIDVISLYDDSGFTIEIESSNVEIEDFICFAPSITKTYYIQLITSTSLQKFIGVFQAIKYTDQQVQDGVSITFNNDDWGYSFIYFTMPDTSLCSDQWDMIVDHPGLTSPYWKKIEASSGDSYNYNQIGWGFISFEDSMYISSGSGFLAFYPTEGLFKITVPGPTITITNPTALTSWTVLTSPMISWTWEGSFTTVTIDLYKGGIYNRTIIDSTENDGSYIWFIPINLKEGSDYNINISSGEIFDISESFTILVPTDSITIINPNSGAIWKYDESHSITWSSTGFITTVRIDLKRGSTYIRTIIASTDNDGTYIWIIPNDLPEATDYIINISSGEIFDVSEPFSIAGPTPSPSPTPSSGSSDDDSGDDSDNDSETSIPGFQVEYLVIIFFIQSLFIIILIYKNRFKILK